MNFRETKKQECRSLTSTGSGGSVTPQNKCRSYSSTGSGGSVTPQYKILYCLTGAEINVSKNVFKKVEAPVLELKHCKIKLIGCKNVKTMKSNLRKFYAEGLPELLDLKEGLSTLVSVVSVIGKVNKFINNIDIRKVILLLKVCKDAYELITGGITLSSFVNVILDLYLAFDFNAESLEPVILAGLTTFLPKSCTDFIRNMQLFTQAKICDDAGIFYTMLESFHSFVDNWLMKIPGFKNIKIFIDKIFNTFKITSSHLLLMNLEKIINDFEKYPDLVIKIPFRDKVKESNIKLLEDRGIKDWERRSVYVSDLRKKWERLHKIVCSYDKINRVEPSCFIFEGRPGSRKSLFVNLILDALQETCYAHSVKAVSDGKDWYDNYNNEDIFYMDDVGQQGISQWRTLINMVSAVKMPLDCAEAKLKDTKFFNSNKIFITTNQFMNLQGLSKTDCISDIKALWRRGYVFDFSGVVGVGSYVKGQIKFMYYNIDRNVWMNSFPVDLVKACPALGELPVVFDCDPSLGRVDCLAWFVKIIRNIHKAKEGFCNVGVLSDSERMLLAEKLGDNRETCYSNISDKFLFNAEGLSNTLSEAWQTIYNTGDNAIYLLGVIKEVLCSNLMRNLVKDIVSDFFLSLKDELGKLLSNFSLTHLLIIVGSAAVITLCIYITKNGLVVKDDIKSEDVIKTDWDAEMFKFDFKNVHNAIPSIVNQMFTTKIIRGGEAVEVQSLISGRYLLVPAHVIGAGQHYVTVFSNKLKNKIIIDNEVVSCVYTNQKEDCAILALPLSFPSPFKDLSKWFKMDVAVSGNSYLINSSGFIPLGDIGLRGVQSVTKYSIGQWYNYFTEKDIMYDFHGMGLCGSLIFDEQNGLQGMHVAGCSSTGEGVSLIWSNEAKKVVQNLFATQQGFTLPFVNKECKYDNSSVMKLNADIHVSAPSKSNIGPSPLYGIYPITREPANLQLNGRFTVKDVAKKSFKPCVFIDPAELDFGELVLRSMLSDFNKLSDKEVVCGNEFLAGLNKDSSNGYNCTKDKNDYIDFEKGEITSECQVELNNICNKILNFEYPWQTFMWVETLKDELRSVEKGGEPRSFRVGTIHQQLLAKRYFGNMVVHILKNKWFNQIMVGVNPYKDWDQIYHTLKKCEGVFACDVKYWDGSMLPQVQRRVVDTIASFYKGDDNLIAVVLLEALVHSLLVVVDDLYVTTHSFPSGHFLTAIVNSMVNKFYTAMWYYRVSMENGLKPTVSGFWADIVDFVYGDDKLNGIRRRPDIFNALSMRNYFVSIGLDMTTSTKMPVVEAFQSLSEIDFLKRKFVFHPLIGRVMCPLDLRTLQSGLSFVDYTKQVDVVVQDKIHNYQREIFLHTDWNFLLEDFKTRLKFYNLQWVELPTEYLLNLYSKDDEMFYYSSLLYK